MDELSSTTDLTALTVALNAVKARIDQPGWADDFCANALKRGGELSSFVGTEFDSLEKAPSTREMRALQWDVQRALRTIEPKFKLAIFTMARDEALHLVEWIAHSLQIGVEHIFVYTNDNRDGTDQILHWLKDHAPVSPIYTTASSSVNIQQKNFRHATLLLPELRLFEWVLVIDVDEFVVPAEKYGYNCVSMLQAAPPDAGGVLFPWFWRLWEPAISREKKLLCELYPHAVPHVLFKSAVRMQHMKSISPIHHPVVDDEYNLYDTAFELVAKTEIWSKKPKSFAGGWIDHYWGRSFEEFLAKKFRGDMLNIPTGQFKRDYSLYFSWTQQLAETNLVPVPSEVVSRMRELLERFKLDPEFAAVMENVERQYADQMSAILNAVDVKALYESLRPPAK